MIQNNTILLFKLDFSALIMLEKKGAKLKLSLGIWQGELNLITVYLIEVQLQHIILFKHSHYYHQF